VLQVRTKRERRGACDEKRSQGLDVLRARAARVVEHEGAALVRVDGLQVEEQR